MQHPSFLEAGWLHYFRRIVEHIHGLHVEYTFTCDVRYRAVPLTWPLLHPPCKVRKRLQTVSHYWCIISLNRLVQFSLRHLANRVVRFRRSTPRFAPIVYKYLGV